MIEHRTLAFSHGVQYKVRDKVATICTIMVWGTNKSCPAEVYFNTCSDRAETFGDIKVPTHHDYPNLVKWAKKTANLVNGRL